ncbi:MAG: hypothetical protein LBV04_04605 [Deferribacteraceae bacterium]|jgi:hypothetical protein|nr:hypothetical protein [Deferribacteraceae bacterium]
MSRKYLYTQESFKIASVMCPDLLLSIGELYICSREIVACKSVKKKPPINFIDRDIDKGDSKYEESDIVYKERIRRKAKKQGCAILHIGKAGFVDSGVGNIELKLIWDICYEQLGKHKCFNVNNPAKNPEECLANTIKQIIELCQNEQDIYNDSKQEKSFNNLRSAIMKAKNG